MRGRILIVDKKVPTPDRDSGSASTFSYLQILSRAGYEIVFVPDTPTERDGYSRALDALGIKTLLAPEWTSTLAGVEAFAPRCDLILLYRAPVAAKVFEVARRAAPPSVKILFHAVDLHFLRLLRQAEASGRRTDLDVAMMTREIELNLVNTCDATIVVSAFEQDLLRELVPSASVHHIPILRDIPQRGWAEVFEHSARRVPCRPGGLGRWLRQHDPLWRKRRDVVFLGGYEHAPNCDAIHWFVGSVWPLLQSRGFPHRLVIAGSNVPPDIVALASDKVEVRGYIHDLRGLFAGCRLSIAPLRYGAGLKGKIVTSLSYGTPVVASPIAAEGTGLKHGESILVGSTPEELADEILRLYEDPCLWQRLSENGYRIFRERFSLSAGARQLMPLVDGLIASRHKTAADERRGFSNAPDPNR